MKLTFCLLLTFLTYTQAYYVFNRSERYSLGVRQLENHSARNPEARLFKFIGSESKTCCHFTEKDCNTTGDPKTVVEFALQRYDDEFNEVGQIFIVTAPAGGWVEIEDESEPFVFYADGTPFPYKYHVNEQH